MPRMNFRLVAHSIVTRLVLLAIAITVMGSVVRYFMLTHFLREDLGAVVASQQLVMASYVARDIEHKITERQAMLGRLAATLPLELLARPEALRAWLGERHELLPLFSHGVFIVDVTGKVVTDYPARPERAGIDYADRDYVRAALAGEAFVGRPVVGRVAKIPVLPLAVPVKDAGGQVRAVLVGITPLAAPGFIDLLQQGRIGNAGGFLLISPRDKLFVASTQPEMVLKPTPPPGVNALHDRAMAGFRGSGITVNAQGVEEISAMVSVPSTGWFVVARLPTAEVFVTVVRAQRYVIANVVGVILFLLVFVAAALLLVFRPLFRAARHADRMTLGEAPLEPLTVVRDDEVGHLTAAFNRLLAKLFATQAELARMAHHDALTNLPNRLLLADRLRQVLARAERNGTRLAVLFLDLDGFKPINDKFGHEAGDAALVQVAERLGHLVRESDTLARVGGDEFVVVMADLDKETHLAAVAAGTVAAKCIEALARPFDILGETCLLGASVGIALGDGGGNPHDLLLTADQAMYRAKQSGRGCYVLAENEIARGETVQGETAT